MVTGYGVSPSHSPHSTLVTPYPPPPASKSDVTVVLQWCSNSVTVVAVLLQWCHSDWRETVMVLGCGVSPSHALHSTLVTPYLPHPA
jgi:hypothetical protein